MEPINLKILYVEDDEDIREEMEIFLSLNFSELIVASNGAEGIEKYREHRPELIITDVMMPVMDGLEMIQNIKAEDGDKLCPLIVLTAFNKSDTNINDIKALGITHIMAKPIDPFILQEKIISIMKEKDA